MEHRDQKIEAVAKRFYEHWMEDDIEEYPFEGASNETEESAREIADIAIQALEEFDGTLPQSRPLLPRSVQEILHDHLTATGLDAWWTGYLRMDPHGQEGFAREAARYFIATLPLGGSARFR
jgi:hypothetical protein